MVTRDLDVAAEVANRVAVLYAEQIVERGPVWDVLRHPAHLDMRGLLASVVRADGAETPGISGSLPDLRRPAARSRRAARRRLGPCRGDSGRAGSGAGADGTVYLDGGAADGVGVGWRKI